MLILTFINYTHFSILLQKEQCYFSRCSRCHRLKSRTAWTTAFRFWYRNTNSPAIGHVTILYMALAGNLAVRRLPACYTGIGRLFLSFADLIIPDGTGKNSLLLLVEHQAGASRQQADTHQLPPGKRHFLETK